VWSQKISIPPLWRVIGNSEGEGVSKALYVLQSLQVRIESLFVYSLRLDKVGHFWGKSKEKVQNPAE